MKNTLIIPRKIFEQGLSSKEIAIYAYIIYCSKFDKHLARVRISTIAKNLSMSEGTVSKYVHLLNDKKFIRLEKTFYTGPDGKKRQGTYIIHTLSHIYK